jgi:hypothetical protein
MNMHDVLIKSSALVLSLISNRCWLSTIPLFGGNYDHARSDAANKGVTGRTLNARRRSLHYVLGDSVHRR